MNREKWRKMALALSASLFVLWWALGTGATLAWFSDADTVRNEFQIGLLDLDVGYKTNVSEPSYKALMNATKVFNDQALYEPGYTQVVYLEIQNNGDVDFNYKLAVTVEGFENGRNAWGDEIYLPDYLRYGVVFAETESKMLELVNDRLKARDYAQSILGTWSDPSPYSFEAGEDPHYAALILCMPEEVDDVANYRGIDVPMVELGITVFAQQANTSMNNG